ncbi:MAG: TIGR04086 family membrane protein [Acutalibacteraceae bacterium]
MGKNKPQKRKRDTKRSPSLKIFLKTQAIAALTYSFVFIVSSAVCLSLDFERKNMFYISALCFAAASFICSYYAGYKIHKNGLTVGLLYALPANIIIALLSVSVNRFKIDLTFLISKFILMISSMLGGILSVNTKLKPKRK